jgi:hypothetical protein
MTILVAWIGVDSRAPASAYIATDSRISWGNGDVWDGGRKTFASKKFPDLFGYVGDVAFPSMMLGQFVEALDAGVLCRSDATLLERQRLFGSMLRKSLTTYPNQFLQSFSIVHVGRAGHAQSSMFEIKESKFDKSARFIRSQLYRSPNRSSVLKLGSTTVKPVSRALGSGESRFVTEYKKWQRSDSGGTSRAVFSAFCDSLRMPDSLTVGGPAQLVGLRKIGNGMIYGTVVDGKATCFGLPLRPKQDLADVEFFNERFDRVNQRGQLIARAQRHL